MTELRGLELERFLSRSNIQVGARIHGGILEATASFKESTLDVLVKDAANRKDDSARRCIPNNTDLEREVAAYELSKILPLVRVPVSVMRTVSVEGVQTKVVVMEKVDHREKRRLWIFDHERYPDEFKYPRRTSVTTKRNAALWDAITGNTDRHFMNWLQDSNTQEIVAIDHGLCFPVPSISRGYIDAVNADWLRNEPLPKWAISWLQKFMDRWDKITLRLQDYLELEARDDMYKRVEYMIRQGKFIDRERLIRRSYAR